MSRVRVKEPGAHSSHSATFEAVGDSLHRFLHADIPKTPRNAPAPAIMNFDMAFKACRDRMEESHYSPAHIAKLHEALRADAGVAFSECESPIEKQLMPWLLCQDYGVFGGHARLHIPKSDDMPPDAPVLLVPQFAFVRYRSDFGIVGRHKGVSLTVAVECDGKDYHKDRERDAKRDAYFAAWGIKTVRATGAEIYHDPRSVARRVAMPFAELGSLLFGKVWPT